MRRPNKNVMTAKTLTAIILTPGVKGAKSDTSFVLLYLRINVYLFLYKECNFYSIGTMLSFYRSFEDRYKTLLKFQSVYRH